jgi:RNA polymerase sigma factor (sigma-70 family)
MLLQTVARARAQGDWRLAEREWEACIARAKQRVERVVELAVARRMIAPSDAEEVVQDALIRGARALVENLESLEEHSFFAAMVTCAKYECLDAGRKRVRRERHEKSLDAPGSQADDDAPGRYDKDLGRHAEERWDRDQEIRDAGKTVDDLLPRLRDERARKLFTLQRLGLKDEAIAEELGVTVVNLYQIRSRALRELRGMISP